MVKKITFIKSGAYFTDNLAFSKC